MLDLVDLLSTAEKEMIFMISDRQASARIAALIFGLGLGRHVCHSLRLQCDGYGATVLFVL